MVFHLKGSKILTVSVSLLELMERIVHWFVSGFFMSVMVACGYFSQRQHCLGCDVVENRS